MNNLGSLVRDALRMPGRSSDMSDLDDPQNAVDIREIIGSKPFLRRLYEEWYSEFVKRTSSVTRGSFVEIGSGGGFLKDVMPAALTSDVIDIPFCDIRLSAEALPFKSGSLGGIFMLDALHHLPNPERFFEEAVRCLMQGGKVIMIEPFDSPFGRFVYRTFHHEPFEPSASGWGFRSEGPMSSANGALPSIIFWRDRKRFENLFPTLRIVSVKPHTPFRYLLSGGVSMCSLVPAWTFSLFKQVERSLSPLHGYIGMFQTIELERVPTPVGGD